jgi:DNA-binding GntR family transcriptional regulator
MNQFVPKRPEHETIYRSIKEMILFGEVAPGQPVTIHGLADVLNTGVTPVREAIRRLTAKGALAALENRRIAVPEMTAHRLDQIALVRLTVEPKLAEMATININIKTIDTLEQIDQQIDQAIQTGDIRSYLQGNYQFHFTLYDMADAGVLRRISDDLWLRIGPCLRVVCGRSGTSKLVDHHREAIAALREGDPEKVKLAITKDIEQGIAFVRQTLAG